MDFHLEVVFRNIPEDRSIRRHVEKQAERLSGKYEGIENCRVIFEIPYHHRYPGNVYELQVLTGVLGNFLKVTRSPSIDGSSLDIFQLLREAFHEMDQKLESRTRIKESAAMKAREKRTGREGIPHPDHESELF